MTGRLGVALTMSDDLGVAELRRGVSGLAPGRVFHFGLRLVSDNENDEGAERRGRPEADADDLERLSWKREASVESLSYDVACGRWRSTYGCFLAPVRVILLVKSITTSSS